MESIIWKGELLYQNLLLFPLLPYFIIFWTGKLDVVLHNDMKYPFLKTRVLTLSHPDIISLFRMAKKFCEDLCPSEKKYIHYNLENKIILYVKYAGQHKMIRYTILCKAVLLVHSRKVYDCWL